MKMLNSNKHIYYINIKGRSLYSIERYKQVKHHIGANTVSVIRSGL